MTRQFENEANPDMHSRTTAREIVGDFKDKLDYWVTGFGTGGTLKGVARVLSKERPDTKIVVCEPDDAPMLTSGAPQQLALPEARPVLALIVPLLIVTLLFLLTGNWTIALVAAAAGLVAAALWLRPRA